MSTDVEKLEDLHEQLRSARALLPQMIRKLAFANDEEGSMQLFHGVAQDLQAWKAASESLQTKYDGLKPLMDELNGSKNLTINEEQPLDQYSYEQSNGAIDLTQHEPEFLDLTK